MQQQVPVWNRVNVNAMNWWSRVRYKQRKSNDSVLKMNAHNHDQMWKGERTNTFTMKPKSNKEIIYLCLKRNKRENCIDRRPRNGKMNHFRTLNSD